MPRLGCVIGALCALSLGATPSLAQTQAGFAAPDFGEIVGVSQSRSVVGVWSSSSWGGAGTYEFFADGAFSGHVSAYPGAAPTRFNGHYVFQDLGLGRFMLTTTVTYDYGAEAQVQFDVYRFEGDDIVVSETTGEVNYRLR